MAKNLKKEEKTVINFNINSVIFYADEAKIYKSVIISKKTKEDMKGKSITYTIKGVSQEFDGSRFFETEKEARQFLKDEAVLKVDDYQTVDWTNV